MVEIKRLSDEMTVSGQIFVDDVAELSKMGVKSIICNRPDGEGADQPNAVEIEKAAKDQNIDYHYLPVDPGNITEKDVDDFRQLYKTVAMPAHVYCRSGTRSSILWARSKA